MKIRWSREELEDEREPWYMGYACRWPGVRQHWYMLLPIPINLIVRLAVRLWYYAKYGGVGTRP